MEKVRESHSGILRAQESTSPGNPIPDSKTTHL